jgi:hypothetical protein
LKVAMVWFLASKPKFFSKLIYKGSEIFCNWYKFDLKGTTNITMDQLKRIYVDFCVGCLRNFFNFFFPLSNMFNKCDGFEVV